MDILRYGPDVKVLGPPNFARTCRPPSTTHFPFTGEEVSIRLIL
jgi:hypothetical protein